MRSYPQMQSPQILPQTLAGWAIAAWGIGGVLLLLVDALVRLSPIAARLLGEDLSTAEGLVLVVWSVFMVYVEGWRGFHLRFSPRVVARALHIARMNRPWLASIAPIAAMGLLYATRRRLVANWLLLLGIAALVVMIRALPPPWRSIIDAGVVLGLGFGALSIVWHAAMAIRGVPLRIDPEFPPA